uniref:Uncharacterized protein n=1 Tax=Opuntia streptacantha TaxID=393608 RepID=A0A7C8YH69_OPUST
MVNSLHMPIVIVSSFTIGATIIAAIWVILVWVIQIRKDTVLIPKRAIFIIETVRLDFHFSRQFTKRFINRHISISLVLRRIKHIIFSFRGTWSRQRIPRLFHFLIHGMDTILAFPVLFSFTPIFYSRFSGIFHKTCGLGTF